MATTYDVLIAGAGPIGLFLACELALAGSSVLVLERDLTSDSPWKAMPLGMRGLNTVSIEALYRRGLLNKVVDGVRPVEIKKSEGFQFGGHFAGIGLNANLIDLSRWKYRFNGPGLIPGKTTIDRMETVLGEHASSLGVKILKGNGITKILSQDDSGVTVETISGQSFAGKWLVACDGGRSLIRKAAGFDFVGTEAKLTGYIVKCDLENGEKLKPGFTPTEKGMYIWMPTGLLYLVDFENAGNDREKEITMEHLQTILTRVTGMEDVKVLKIHLASNFTDRAKQATSYRKGRILLAGDAAHIHSALGAQGMNLGMGDALNLGWKLAATIRQQAAGNEEMTLIDSYEDERHLIAARVLDWSRAQVATLEPNPFGKAMQTLIQDLSATTDGTNVMIERVWGLSQRYVLGEGAAFVHPLVGSTAPDVEFEDGQRLGEKMGGGRGLLVDFDGREALKEMVAHDAYGSRVEYLSLAVKDKRDLKAMLVRPDGTVAWVVDAGAEPDLKALRIALERWFSF